MAKINLNKLAKNISLAEGKKVQINIAQIKEVLKCVFFELKKYSDEDILEAIKR